MTRRAAVRIPDAAPGFVVEQLVKTDANLNQTMVYVFEASGPGLTTEETINNVHLTDGSPAQIPYL